VRLDKNGQVMGIDIPQDTLQPDAVKFFPNPVYSQASIEWEGAPPPGSCRILIISLSGQIIHSQEYNSEKRIDLELGKLPQGTYLYQIIYGGKNLSGKFMTR